MRDTNEGEARAARSTNLHHHAFKRLTWFRRRRVIEVQSEANLHAASRAPRSGSHDWRRFLSAHQTALRLRHAPKG